MAHGVMQRLGVAAGSALAAAGVALFVILTADPLAALGTPYGQLLAVKLALFTLLLGLAALNRYRLTPALQMRTLRAGANLRRSIRLEALVVLAVLATTATLTTVASPEWPAEHGTAGEARSSAASTGTSNLTSTSSPHRHG